MFTEENNVFYAPLGDTRGNPLEPLNKNNTVETLISVEQLRAHSEEKNQMYWDKLLNKGIEQVSVWGMSAVNERLVTIMREDDIVFLGYKNCVLYIGQVMIKMHDPNLTLFLWNERDGWEYKIVLKNLVRVYIPGSVGTLNNLKLQDGVKNIDNVKSLVNKGSNFRTILGFKETETYNLQGIHHMKETNAVEVSERLTEFVLRSNFACVIRSINNGGLSNEDSITIN